MLSRTKLSFPTLSLSLLTTLLLGCAPEDGADTAADQPTGTVNILFTDAPTDDFSAINVTLSRIELIPFNDGESDADSDAGGGDDDDSDNDRPSRRAALFMGEATFDLLQLENFTSLFSVTPDVPAGEYRKIRLTVSALELIDRETGVAIKPRLPGDGKLDLVSRSPFLVEPDSTLLVTIDIDARRSIRVNADEEGGFRFRPVVFVTVSNAPPSDPDDPGDSGDPGTPPDVPVKFVRVQGYMNRIDLAGGSFGMQVPNINGAQFDITLPQGAPVFLSNGNLATQNFEVSDNLATAVGNFDPNDATLFRAVVLNTGFLQDFVYTTLSGSARAAPANGEFSLALNGVADVLVLTTPETQVFNNTGEPADFASIGPGTFLEIDGRHVDAGTFQATLVVVLVEETQSQVQVTGQIVALNGEVATVATDLGDRCVRVGDAAISLHAESPDGISIGAGSLAELQAGSELDAAGIEGEDGCLQAQSVMVFSAI